MAKDYAKGFYKSKQWQQVSRLYMGSKCYVCERCGGVGEICHHKKYITPANIDDPNITLSFDNLECLCRECHNKEHMLKRSRVTFDSAGNVERVTDAGAFAEHKQAAKAIDGLLKRLKERATT